jgi:amino acid adenylation domain-containing protein
VDMTARSLSDVLRHTARRSPDKPALVGDKLRLTYAELDRRTDGLARRLHAAGLRAGDRAGMCVERGDLPLLVSAALLRLGCAYLPIDPRLPVARIQRVIDRSRIAACVCDEAGFAAVDGSSLSVIAADAGEPEAAADGPPPGPGPGPDTPAYVMFTSGSTGEPKGIEVSHDNVSALLNDALPLFPRAAGAIWPMQHSPSFDVSVWEIWAGIATGATLVSVDGPTSRDPGLLAECLLRHRVTRLHIVPSVFRHLAEIAAEEKIRLPLREVVFCGEAVNRGAIGSWPKSRSRPAPRWFNVYGITETTVYNTFKEMSAPDIERPTAAAPIGRGYANSPVIVLDERLSTLPPGETGEIFIGGRQVTRGYLYDPERTAERFITLAGRPGRWYRTGDLGFSDADGELHYVGRRDDQVKVRGFRIELGEIDHAMRRLGWIADAAAVVRESARGEQLITAFVVPATGTVSDSRVLLTRLRAGLAEALPEHMLPGKLVCLDRLPLNPNGKTDRGALSGR